MQFSPAENYKDINFKCGIEIHQQIDSKKLFCNCSSKIIDKEPEIIVKRKLRPVAGETGEIDRAAMHEFLKNKEIIYEGYHENTCLVEFDEEPPHEINREALDVVLKFSLLTNAKIFKALQVMRKTVIDGSNPSGFQRTCLVAVDGKISTSLGDVRIQSICIEEDAARKISEDENSITYRLDRLGIPLIEIATYPDIKSPEHAKETAEKIGTILRTLKVKRGIGTIRQDINVSIKDGARVEIKGCQELNSIPKILNYEINRQKMLINLKNLNLCKEEELNVTPINLGEIFKETKCKIIKNALENNGVVYGIKLKNFSGKLGNKFCATENTPRFGKELSDYLKAKTKLKGLFHSDELPNYGISEEEIKKILKILNCNERDAFVILAGEKEEVIKGLNVIIERVKIALKYVPEETRRATEKEETEYMRPLPEAARMYPETDIPIIYINDEYLQNLKKELPETIDEKFKRYENLVGKELANQLIHSKYNEIFDKFVEKFKIRPSIIANTILSIPYEIKKKYDFKFEISENLNLIEKIFEFLEKGIISHSSIPEILYYAKKENKDIEKIINERDLKIATKEEILKKINEILSKDQTLKTNKGKLIGIIMKEFKGKARSDDVKEIIENLN